jgi:hypothetical protein
VTAGPSADVRHALSAEAIDLLGLTPRTARLLSAVHEAGHAVVADTVGLRVTRARVTSADRIGVGSRRRTPGPSAAGTPTRRR